MLEEIVHALEIKEDDTFKTAAVKGTVEGLLIGFTYLGILYTIGHVVGKLKK